MWLDVLPTFKRPSTTVAEEALVISHLEGVRLLLRPFLAASWISNLEVLSAIVPVILL
jgi:hypothetical protein